MQINELSFCPYLQVLFESSLYSLHQSNFRILEHLAVFLDKGRLHLETTKYLEFSICSCVCTLYKIPAT